MLPREIHVPVDFEDRELLENALTERKGRRVHILAPQRGEKRDMIDLVEKNAKLAFEQRFRVLKPDMKRVLEEMQETLELPRFPARIESFDVSHIQGAENVAGMVVCENGKMNRSEYRKFKIRWSRRRERFRFDARSGAAPLSPCARRRKAACRI